MSPDLRCATRDAQRRWALVYSTKGQVIKVAMNRLAEGRADAFWYNPRNGLWHDEGQDHDAKTRFGQGIPSGGHAPDLCARVDCVLSKEGKT